LFRQKNISDPFKPHVVIGLAMAVLDPGGGGGPAASSYKVSFPPKQYPGNMQRHSYAKLYFAMSLFL